MNEAAKLTATQLQRAALDARASVYIAANAGTGKTEVLTYRIIALLLANFELSPSNILGLTFTKAAAAEMAARLTELLHEWNGKDDRSLQTKLQDVFGLDITPQLLKRFRQLPALVADAPPTLTTIHGFAQQLLGRLSEGDALPQPFELVEDAAQLGLLPAALARAVHHANESEQQSLDLLLEELGDNGWRELSGLFEHNWQAFIEVVQQGNFTEHLQQALGLTTPESELEKQLLPTPEEQQALRLLAPGVFNGSLATWMSYLFIKEGEGTPAIRGFPALKKEVDAHPAAAQTLRDAQTRVEQIRNQLRGWQSYHLTLALMVWWSAVRHELDILKEQRRLKTHGDFLGDLEHLLQQAMNNEGRGQWLAQRLERRYAHLLVDEAQDNSPQQARLVHMLAQVFLSGDVGTGERTVLAVGDPKQSIYRFQGARQQLFSELETFLHTWSGQRLVNVTSKHSFRSSAPLIQAVEDVFANEDLRASLGSWTPHSTVYPHAWGRAELWPLTIEPEAVKPEPFRIEATPQYKADGANLFGTQLAAWLHARKAEGCVMPSTGKPLAWGDILVLVQRNSTAMAIAGALSAAHTPAVAVSGKGAPPPVVSDITALIRYLNGPTDTLALAQVLKSPLCSWSDTQLLQLAQNDWQLTGQPAKGAAEWLTHWQARAAAVPPPTWLAELLQRPDVFSAYAQRGPLPPDALRAELAGLLAAAEPHATMADLLASWETTPPRPLGESGDVVRVMTVHKAKGLGAPLVVVAETTRSKKADDHILWQRNEHGQATLMLLARKKALAPQFQTQLEEEENNRLDADQASGLYVALTRAKDWLVIGGWSSEKNAAENQTEKNHWYAQVAKAAANWKDDNGIKIRESGTLEKQPHPAALSPSHPLTLLPSLAPLQPFPWPQEEPYIPTREAALQRGTLQHRLLHALAPLPPQNRATEGERLLTLWQSDVKLLQPVLNVFEKHPYLFTPQSEGEVPIVVNDAEGRIDRLIDTGNEIHIIDFKTESTPPATVPESYRQQLTAYKQALAPAYPGKTIKTGLLWLAGNQLAWLD
jgi:ATP-dependent helicase/nuclease subunit A